MSTFNVDIQCGRFIWCGSHDINLSHIGGEPKGLRMLRAAMLTRAAVICVLGALLAPASAAVASPSSGLRQVGQPHSASPLCFLRANALRASIVLDLISSLSRLLPLHRSLCSRHGVRGPYGLGTESPSEELLKQYVRNPNLELPLSANAWGTSETEDPAEIVSPKLTKHGFRVVERMGRQVITSEMRRSGPSCGH